MFFLIVNFEWLNGVVLKNYFILVVFLFNMIVLVVGSLFVLMVLICVLVSCVLGRFCRLMEILILFSGSVDV